MCTHTPVCGVQKKIKKNQLSIAAQSKSIAPRLPHPAASLSFNLFQSICAGQSKLYKRKKRKGVHLCVYQVRSDHPGFSGTLQAVRKVYVCLNCLSCFRRAIEGRRCYCWGGPEDPGTTTAHLGSPALEEAVRTKEWHKTFGQALKWTEIIMQDWLWTFLLCQDSRLKMAQACPTLLGCPNCWRGWRPGRRGDGCWGRVAVVAAVAEEAELAVTAGEAHCGVAAALIGSQGVEMHVSSAAMDHATGHCQQSEVSVERGGKYWDLGCN